MHYFHHDLFDIFSKLSRYILYCFVFLLFEIFDFQMDGCCTFFDFSPSTRWLHIENLCALEIGHMSAFGWAWLSLRGKGGVKIVKNTINFAFIFHQLR